MAKDFEVHDIGMQQRLNYYQEKVVWGHWEEGQPTFHDGSAGEHEINHPVTAKDCTFWWEQINVLTDQLHLPLTEAEKRCIMGDRYVEGYVMTRSVADTLHMAEERVKELEAELEQITLDYDDLEEQLCDERIQG